MQEKITIMDTCTCMRIRRDHQSASLGMPRDADK